MINNPNLDVSLYEFLNSVNPEHDNVISQWINRASSALGPLGDKVIINHQDKLNELVAEHSETKHLVLAAEKQHQKFGDGANLVISIGGHHLEGAKELITMGLTPTEIIGAYTKATNKLPEILEDLSRTMDVRNKDQVTIRLKHPVCSIIYDAYDMQGILCRLIPEACIQVCPPVDFNVDNVRVARLLGVHPRASKTFRGMVLDFNTVVGSIKTIKDAQVLVLAGGGVANFEALIKKIEPKVLVSKAPLEPKDLQFCNFHGIMVLNITSQSELECFCRTTNAVASLNTVDSPYIGHADSISVEKTGGYRVNVTKEQGDVVTILLGLGKRDNIYEQFQRAVVSGVKTYKALCKDSKVVPGVGATEIEIAKRLKKFSCEHEGSSSDAIAIPKYAESFELIPKALADNYYLNVEDIMKKLKADHDDGKFNVGIDVYEGECKDASTLKIWDLYTTKLHAFECGAEAVCDALLAHQAQEADKNLSVIQNINAYKQLSTITQDSFGPYSDKLISKHKDKLNEFVVKHPAAKHLVLAVEKQQTEFGDGANLVLSIGGHHLKGAEELITNRLTPTQIIEAYAKATNKLPEILEDLSMIMDVRNKDQVILRLKDNAYEDKYAHNYEDMLCPLIAEACIGVCPQNQVDFNVDNVRVARLLGVPPHGSKTFRGMVLDVNTFVGNIMTVKDAKVLVLAGGGVANFKELYNKIEPRVLVSKAPLEPKDLQFCNSHGIMVLNITSQSELECFCRTTNAVASLDTVDPPYIGHADSISVEKTRGDRVTVTKEQGGVATILLGQESQDRPDDDEYYEQLKRAVVSRVKTYKALCKDSKVVPGAGATEMEIAKRLKRFSVKYNGSDEIAIAKYAESFELIPKLLAENSHLDVEVIMKNLKADHEAGKSNVGIDVDVGFFKDASTLKIWDLYTTKLHALQCAAAAVREVLSVDQAPQHRLLSKALDFVRQTCKKDQRNDKMSEILERILQEDKKILQEDGQELKIEECKWLAAIGVGERVFGLSENGWLFLVDKSAGQYCWSQKIKRVPDLSQTTSTSEVDSSFIIISSKDMDEVSVDFLCSYLSK